MREFLNMGGYAFYVWTSYAIALVVLVANFVAPMRRRTELMNSISRRLRRERSR